MSGFLGNGPRYARGSRFSFFPTAGATSVGGTDSKGLTLTYTPGYEMVTLNGSFLDPSDYTTDTGSTITFAAPLAAGDVVNVYAVGMMPAVDQLSRLQNGADIANKAAFRANLLSAGHIIGEPANGVAAAGEVGEIFFAEVTGPGTARTSGVAANIISLALTAGDWDVSGVAAYSGGGTTQVAGVLQSISLVSATQDNTNGRQTGQVYGNQTIFAANIDNRLAVGPTQILLPAPATVYLVSTPTFTTNVLSSYGSIRARRAR